MERSEIRGRRFGLLSRSRITLRSIRATIVTALLFQLGDLGAAVLGVERVEDVIKQPMSGELLPARACQQHGQEVGADGTRHLRSNFEEVGSAGGEIDFALPAGADDAALRFYCVTAGRPADDKIRAGRKLADLAAIDEDLRRADTDNSFGAEKINRRLTWRLRRWLCCHRGRGGLGRSGRRRPKQTQANGNDERARQKAPRAELCRGILPRWRAIASVFPSLSIARRN